MDIYSAQKNTEKLLRYVQGLADTKPNFYEKSKDRLRDLASTCGQVMSVIAEILQDEVLIDDDSEFASGRGDLKSILNSMQTQLDQLKAFSGVNTEQEDNSKSKSKAPSRNKGQILKDYRLCLSKLSTIDSGYSHVDECARLLWRWFDTRFLKLSSGSKFKYNMKRFPMWIRDIVVLYGSALHDGSQLSFLQEFQAWLDSIAADTNARDKYAIPYNIYQFNRSPSGEQATLEAAVIWDMLFNFGLREICREEDEFYPTESSVYDICDTLNPSSLDFYQDYVSHPEVLDHLGWRLQGGAI